MADDSPQEGRSENSGTYLTREELIELIKLDATVAGALATWLAQHLEEVSEKLADAENAGDATPEEYWWQRFHGGGERRD